MKRYERVIKTNGRTGRKKFPWPALFLAAAAVCLAWAALRSFGIGGLPGRLPGGASQPASSALQPSGQSSSGSATSSPSPAAGKDVSITILGAGDDLIHGSIYKQAKQRAGGAGYDFAPVYAHVAEEIKSADIAVINQETVLAGKALPVSDYPLFNSPTEVGDALVNIGFDVINHANNHILDKGEKGIKATLDYWDTKPVKVTGAYRDDEDLENIRIVEKKGIRTAYLGFTEMTNGLYLPKESPYRIVYTSDTATIQHLIQKAKGMADVVVVSVHWGTENTYTLTDKQKTLAQQMVDWGADIIFGNHPHVVQQLTVLSRSSDGAKCPVIFALGNFVSAQQSGKNMVSGLLTVTMTKSGETGRTSYTSMKFTPIVTHYGSKYSNITVYPFSGYTDAMAAQHGVRAFTPNFSRSFIQNIIDQNIPKKYQNQFAE